MSINMNNFEKPKLSFDDIFGGTLDTYTFTKNEPTLGRSGGGCTISSVGS